MEMEKQYNPAEIEKRLYAEWESKKYFAPRGKGKPFSIVIPPPNVTGALHMGHALDNTLQDLLIRWHRMLGDSVLWVPGTDHAGIATQNVVERSIAKDEGKTRHDYGREDFIKKVWEWKEQYGNRITQQLRLLGSSCDWDHERFTMDEGCSLAVRETFVSLYKQKLIFKGKRIINWCPRCHTALSDVEVDFHEQTGNLWKIKYPVVGEAGKFIIVATTRPETLLGDTAVAVNPDDERYAKLIGKKVKLPLTDKEIPIIADSYVDSTFGTGAVKITPAHDANDYEVGKRHNLQIEVVMDTSGVMNENCPVRYRGLDRSKAREVIVADLEEQGLLAAMEEYQNKISTCYRCKSAIEPYVSEQWFVDMPKLAQPAIDAVTSKKITFHPERWTKVYLDWMENIKEWCISRQIWWGHRIPVWYCQDCGLTLCEVETPTVCPCSSTRLVQDEDVLDTWFSSALWPFSTMGWPKETVDLFKYYPTSNLVTGYDIITFWVSRMITMGLKLTDLVPFEKVIIHGLIRDEQGRKMSKSTGNAVDPVELIEAHGADALRFTMTSMVTSGGQDVKLVLNKVIASRNFMNKLWNVTRFTLMKIEEGTFATEKTLADAWILSRFQKIITTTNEALEKFHFGEIANNLYDFTWSELCDWYIEMSKLSLHKETLLTVLKGVLKLLHPITPFITEELWSKLGETDTIMYASWPVVDTKLINEQAESQVNTLIEIIKAIRNVRAEMNVPASKKANVILLAKTPAMKSAIQAGSTYIKSLAQVEHIDLVDKLVDKPRDSSYAVVTDAEIYIPLANLIDLSAEIKRLEKEVANLDLEVERVKKKLMNQSFVDKAPPEVIEGEKAKEKMYSEKRKIVLEQLNGLKAK